MKEKEGELRIKQALDDALLLGELILKRVPEHTFSHSRQEVQRIELTPSYVLSLYSSKL